MFLDLEGLRIDEAGAVLGPLPLAQDLDSPGSIRVLQVKLFILLQIHRLVRRNWQESVFFVFLKLLRLERLILLLYHYCYQVGVGVPALRFLLLTTGNKVKAVLDWVRDLKGPLVSKLQLVALLAHFLILAQVLGQERVALWWESSRRRLIEIQGVRVLPPYGTAVRGRRPILL